MIYVHGSFLSLCVAMTARPDEPAVVWQIEGRVELRSAGGLNSNSSLM